ncbi:MAG: phosphohydrolase, partial [Pseudomonadota bacterium]
MKILLLADLHYDLKKFDWVAHLASHFDVVVIAGDHLDLASIVDRPAQAVVVQKYFRRIQQQTELL